MASTDITAGKPQDLEARVARLRGQVDTLAVDRVTPAVNKFTADVGRFFADTSSVLQSKVGSLGRHIEQRPLTSMLIAVVLGVVIGRARR
ncbi:hypothetical protein [Rhodopila sp.]|uniref:hypothetical protein n=1 Tax=Rhodopila sp. TaxID=2480087 RepID=UPI003D0FAE3B